MYLMGIAPERAKAGAGQPSALLTAGASRTGYFQDTSGYFQDTSGYFQDTCGFFQDTCGNLQSMKVKVKTFVAIHFTKFLRNA